MTVQFVIDDARVHHVNGTATLKEIILDVHCVAEDGDGSFRHNEQMTVPVSWITSIGDRLDLCGKMVTVVVPL